MSGRDRFTGDLFAAIPRPAPAVEGGMDYRARLSHLVSEMLAAAHVAGVDRYEVAARTSRLAGKEVSKAMLDGYTSEAREAFNLPLYLVPALEVACESVALSNWLAETRGGRLVLGAAALDAEIGRMEAELDDQKARLSELKTLRKKVR
jgi:hypothetical protein